MCSLLLELSSFKLYLISKSSWIYEYIISPLTLSTYQSTKKKISGFNVLIENLWIYLLFSPDHQGSLQGKSLSAEKGESASHPVQPWKPLQSEDLRGSVSHVWKPLLVLFCLFRNIWTPRPRLMSRLALSHLNPSRELKGFIHVGITFGHLLRFMVCSDYHL